MGRLTGVIVEDITSTSLAKAGIPNVDPGGVEN